MRRIAIRLLGAFRRITLLIRKMRGKTLDDVAEQRVVSGKAREEFCTRDPMTQLRRIYEVAEIDFDDEARKMAKQYVAANPQNRFGKHHYRLEHFGLSEQDMDETFAAYRKAYGIPFE